MFDVQLIGSATTTLLRAVVSWLPGQCPTPLLLEILVWLAGVAGLGMLLAQLRALSLPARPWRRPYVAPAIPAERRRWCSRLLLSQHGGD